MGRIEEAAVAVQLRKRKSAFDQLGYKDTIDSLVKEVQVLYKADSIPWVVGYSGGKDSTAVLQLVWMALKELDQNDRHKKVNVISTDTMVENPVVAAWVANSLENINRQAEVDFVPITAHRLTPTIEDSFWVNLIGRGYPAPRPRFRWCTERLKIKPSNQFIRDIVKQSGEAILVLGTRKAESSARSGRMTALEEERVRDRLSPNQSLPNSLVFSPIEDWSNDDVWLFLMQQQNPWGYDNHELLAMYRGASEDNECPLVVDTSTPSCGDSRFGCWVCTLVEQDKSMAAMIQNDDEKSWMLPLLELRNALDVADDRHLRDFRRMDGRVQLFHDKTIPGPYTQSAREDWLLRLLKAQAFIQANGPESVRGLELISLNELSAIRHHWVDGKHEIEDSLPLIYERALGQSFPGPELEEQRIFGLDEVRLLKELCGDDVLHFEMTRSLLDVEWRYQTMARRRGHLEQLESTIVKGFYDDAEDAMDRAKGFHLAQTGSSYGDQESIDAPDFIATKESASNFSEDEVR
jgi:DNA sulfur modification protein DndC